VSPAILRSPAQWRVARARRGPAGPPVNDYTFGGPVLSGNGQFAVAFLHTNAYVLGIVRRLLGANG
jgi:hypothetical protein